MCVLLGLASCYLVQTPWGGRDIVFLVQLNCLLWIQVYCSIVVFERNPDREFGHFAGLYKGLLCSLYKLEEEVI